MSAQPDARLITLPWDTPLAAWPAEKFVIVEAVGNAASLALFVKELSARKFQRVEVPRSRITGLPRAISPKPQEQPAPL